jgi:membrane-bound lytic murein transglycosylase D
MTLPRYLALVSVIVVSGLTLSMLTANPTITEPEPDPRPPKALPIEVTPELPLAPTITWDLPVARNERVDYFIRFLTGRNREKTALWLERSGRYGPMTREKLRARGMPEDLTYLALIESGFSPAATSRAKAIGLWQFIEETGRRYGLKVTPYVDERRDPLKATDAALAYLQELYGRFGSWYLAAAAYNTGENRVERILRERAGSARGEEELYWQISPFLPRETRDYVPLMLAAGHIGKEPERYGFESLDYHPLLTFDTVRTPGGISLELIARAVGVAAAEIFDLNPHYIQKVTPPGSVADVRIPQGRSPIFESNFARVASAKQASDRVRPAARVVRVSRRWTPTRTSAPCARLHPPSSRGTPRSRPGACRAR